MRNVILLACAVVAFVVVPAMSVPPIWSGKESWEYNTGFGDPNYIANWPTFGGLARIEVKSNRVWTGARNLWIVNGGNGMTYDLSQDFAAANPLADSFEAGDVGNDRIALQFSMHSKGSNGGRKFASCFVELSMGAVHAPNDWAYAGPVLPVIAYGWTRGISSSKITPSYFDGGTWHGLGNIDQHRAWNHLIMWITSTTCNIANTRFSGSTTLPRQYLGAFDTASVRSVANADKERSMEDYFITRGLLTGPPVAVDVDVMPNDDPNEFTVTKKGGGKLPIAIFGSAALAATDIDPTSILVAGVTPLKTSTDKDVDGDGLVDLVVHMSKRDLIDTLSLDAELEGAVVDLEVTGTRLSDGWAVAGVDSIVIHHPPGQQ